MIVSSINSHRLSDEMSLCVPQRYRTNVGGGEDMTMREAEPLGSLCGPKLYKSSSTIIHINWASKIYRLEIKKNNKL